MTSEKSKTEIKIDFVLPGQIKRIPLNGTNELLIDSVKDNKARCLYFNKISGKIEEIYIATFLL